MEGAATAGGAQESCSPPVETKFAIFGSLLAGGHWWNASAFTPLLRKELLLLWTAACVVSGAALGCLLRSRVNSEAVDYLALPGNLLMAALKELVLPFVSLSLITGIVGLRRLHPGLSHKVQVFLGLAWLLMVIAVGMATYMMHVLQLGQGLVPLLRASAYTNCTATIEGLEALENSTSITPAPG
eukprot:TRINITY_DN39251_c0_g1_i1.p1 TRINITY_DN39251_c0_g1~~TRINITY_DN39251_c0_g1_i1.p1  ORF type:complete len:185 (-),score=41.21 TRINITY_DN39251_c0_g1_i1:141-695(-)